MGGENSRPNGPVSRLAPGWHRSQHGQPLSGKSAYHMEWALCFLTCRPGGPLPLSGRLSLGLPEAREFPPTSPRTGSGTSFRQAAFYPVSAGPVKRLPHHRALGVPRAPAGFHHCGSPGLPITSAAGSGGGTYPDERFPAPCSTLRPAACLAAGTVPSCTAINHRFLEIRGALAGFLRGGLRGTQCVLLFQIPVGRWADSSTTAWLVDCPLQPLLCDPRLERLRPRIMFCGGVLRCPPTEHLVTER